MVQGGTSLVYNPAKTIAAASPTSRILKWYMLNQGFLPKPGETDSEEHRDYCYFLFHLQQPPQLWCPPVLIATPPPPAFPQTHSQL